MSVRVAQKFRGQWTCFFATCYSVELELFDQYLFRRLGEPPLNATILCDFDTLARRIDRLDLAQPGQLQRANRDYLLRGVTAGSSFHPKTYFFGNAKEGSLLVGSGNLTLRGIEEGHEVFCHFDSSRDDELGSIRAWRDWMEQLVGRLADREVTRRWLDLKERTREWLPGTAAGSAFVSNFDRSFLDQVGERLPTPVSELHVLAPFYDRDAKALETLVQRLQPQTLHLYIGAGTSVDGAALTAVLERFGGKVKLIGFEPPAFVHAKLVGAIKGKRGVLLSGSPNLSLAAFTSTVAATAYANIEAGVLVGVSAELVRGAFRPRELELRPETLATAAALAYTTDEEGLALPLRLRAARRIEKERVEVEFEGSFDGDVYVTAGGDAQPVVDARTAEPLALAEGSSLVWLCDGDGAQLSNRVLVDDPATLRAWLQERTSGGERPRELDPVDISRPVGQLLQWLHEVCIFDIDETPAASRARRLANEESRDEDAGWGFLEELTKEELRLDPRVDHYRHATATGLPEDDEVLALLRLMLELTPGERGLWAVGSPTPEAPEPPKPGTPWTAEQRLRVRVFNVLERWCGALNDPRFVWIDPSAPVRNYSALLAALARCWQEEFLPHERVVRLLETLFSSFMRSERAAGYLQSLSAEDRENALAGLPGEARLLAGALCYALLREETNWRDIIFRLQPFLIAALELGVVEVGPHSPKLVKRLVGEKVSAPAIEERLSFACEYTDDEHWCARQERELGFTRVVLTHRDFKRDKFAITLAVEGASLEDPRLVSLVRQALAYRNAEGVVVEIGDTRLAVRLGEPVAARVNGAMCLSRSPIGAKRLVDAERHGVSFARMLDLREAVA